MSKFACSAIQRVGFMHSFISRKPAVTHMNDPGLANLLYRSVNYTSYLLSISVILGILKLKWIVSMGFLYFVLAIFIQY